MKRKDNPKNAPKLGKQPSKESQGRVARHALVQRNRASEVKFAAPVATSKTRTTGKPTILSGPTSTSVIHSEFVCDVYASNGFVVNTLYINPKNVITFPWLSIMAPSFESFRFNRISFRFETTSRTTQLGSVYLAIDYDASDDVPTDKVEMMAYEGSTRSAPWQENGIDFDKRLLHRKVSWFMSGNSPDILEYRVANFHYATEGQEFSQNNLDGVPLPPLDLVPLVGELYVDYEVELYVPTLEVEPSAMLFNSGAAQATRLSGKPLFLYDSRRAKLYNSRKFKGMMLVTADADPGVLTVPVSRGDVSLLHSVTTVAGTLTAGKYSGLFRLDLPRSTLLSVSTTLVVPKLDVRFWIE